MIGRTLSHYEIVGEIGAGGMGVVYRARDTLLERFVALKVLPSDAVADESRRRRFLHEARAASALNHPNIITIHDILQADGIHAIVMEIVDGSSLQRRLVSGPLPTAQALAIAHQIADALAAAHAAGIIHRDLKPANVMLTERGQVKVLDFGIAKLDVMRASTDDGTHTAPLTVMGLVLGTAAYMSPEQARGEAVDGRTDVFSLGVVLYEMLSGKSPFAASTITAVLHKLIYEDPPDFATYGLDLPPAVAATVHRALAKKPADRFQSMDAMLAVLEALTAGRSPSLTSAAAAPAAASTASRRSMALTSAAIVAVIVGIGGMYAARQSGWFEASDAAGNPPAAAVELPATAFEAYQKGQALLGRYDREGYIDQSIDAFRRAIGLKPDYPAAYAGLGLAYWRKYRDQRDGMHLQHATENAARAVELDPQLTLAQVSLAFVKIESGELEAADTLIQDALTRDPGNADVLAARAYLRLRQKQVPEALEAIRQAVQARSGDWSLSLMEGVILFNAGKPADAVAPLERAATLAPDSALVYRNLGAAYHGADRYKEATASFQSALAIKPDPAVYNNLGTLLFSRGLYDQSIDAFDRAVKLGANEYRTWGNLADAYRFTPGRSADARAAYTRALQLLDEQVAKTPTDIDLGTRRVAMLAKRGDCSTALAAAGPLRNDANRSSAAIYRLGVAYEVCGRRDEALDAIAMAAAAGYSLEQLQRDPELVKLRADVRFHRFVSGLADPPKR
jgi:serine/threonine-protein kinase